MFISDICRIPAVSVDPMLKTYHWLDLEMAQFQAYDHGADTAVLVDRDGNVTEGPGFNVFAVKDGQVLTPEAGAWTGLRARPYSTCAPTQISTFARSPFRPTRCGRPTKSSSPAPPAGSCRSPGSTSAGSEMARPDR